MSLDHKANAMNNSSIIRTIVVTLQDLGYSRETAKRIAQRYLRKSEPLDAFFSDYFGG